MASSSTLPPPIQDSIPVPSQPLPTSSNSHSNSHSSSSSSSRPSQHTQKYDRQLRLWASAGQTALENANLLVINSNATATSTLKNLVLPGIGKFTMLDQELVEESDLGVNFFLDPTSLGKSRAQESVKFLGELNTDVKGDSLVKSLPQFLEDEEALKEYTLILAVDVVPKELEVLLDRAWGNGVPVIKVESYGFYGSLSAQIEEITLVETHPESLIDLRLNSPFDELVEYANTFEYASMDSATHGHVPAVVILIKALQEWKSTHEGNGPSGTKERKEFLDGVIKEKRTSDEENFDEAVGLFRRAGNKPNIPEEIEKLFKDDSCQNLTSTSSNFWILLHSIHLFTQLPSNPSHLLPLTGSLPDMKAHSQTYTTLQRIYRSKAKSDLSKVEEILKGVLEKCGDGDRVIGKEELESFVKHSGWVKVLRGKKISTNDNNTVEQSASLKGKINQLLEEASYSQPPDQSLSIHLSFLTSSRFYTLHSRYPGSLPTDTDGTTDHQECFRIVKELLSSLDYTGQDLPESIENCIKELCRSSNSTLPQTSALLGGLVAQETIKLVTHQYVPVVGETVVWDGITSATGRIKL